MQFRNMANLDWKPSALGFGAMRLPVINGDQSNVDMDEAAGMIRYAIDKGVNYVDTAYFYHGGNSEKALGYALQDGYRDRIKLATKFPAWEVESAGDFDSSLERQLNRLKTDKIDFYLLHGLHRPVFERLQEMGIIPWLEKKVGEGILEYLGFSFHDEYDYFETVADGYDNWTFCQVQFNYMDIADRAGNSRMKPDELELVEKVRQAYFDSSPLPCTACRYCMPCPNGVEIPVIFSIYSQMKMYDDSRMARMRYNNGPWGVTPDQNASNCIECGECIERCPQHIAIPEWLKKAHEELTQ